MKKIYVLFSMLYCVLSAQPWTTTYHFNPQLFREYPGKIVVQKNAYHTFNQLLVSWNSDMPEYGYFRFFLEVFDEKNHLWLPYKMYEWGKGVQRSFSEKNNQSVAHYAHVRFEGAPGVTYRRFKITIESIDGAALSMIRHIAVCASDVSLFKGENVRSLFTTRFKNMYIYLDKVPHISQHDQRYPESVGWCSPASLVQVITYYTGKEIDLSLFAQSVYDQNLASYGSWPFSTAYASTYLSGHISYVTRLNSIKNLMRLVSQGYPIIVSICCSTPLPGAPKAYDKGHLITVVGFDLKKNEVICHDTAERDPADSIKQYPLEPFMQAWERRQRLAYVIVPDFTAI